MASTNPVAPQGARPENYERYFVPTIGEPIAHELLRIAELKPGERVLDVGCGTGIVTRLAAQEVGDGGTVVGVDIDPGMLAVARSVSPPELHIGWHEAGAEKLPLENDSFDVALCQMSLQFVEDRAKALAEMHRVLVTGGRILIDLPGHVTPPFESLAESMGRHIAKEGKGFVQRVFSLHDSAEVKKLLTKAGFRRVEVREVTRSLSLPAPREFLWQYVSSTPLADVMTNANGKARDAFEKDVIQAWQPYAEEDGMALEQPMLFAKAFK
jgi:ubiquinone/menaquinone biosynthesis C-methylase UbiE